MTRSRSRPIPAAVAGLLIMAGCATGKSKTTDTNPFSQELAERNEVQIQVKNHNFSDATVWALVRDGRRTRLGYVTGKTDAVFTMPWRFPEPLRLEFDLIADVRCVTEQIVVDPGDILELQISLDPRSDPQCR